MTQSYSSALLRRGQAPPLVRLQVYTVKEVEVLFGQTLSGP